MTFNSKNGFKHKGTSPPLEVLIGAIDRQIDQVPHPYVAEGFEALLGDVEKAYKNQGRQYIRFLLDNTAFALPLQNALEIDYVPEITQLPNLPSWIIGVCNLRGDIVSVVDPKQIIGLKATGVDSTKKLILIRDEDISTAILVDKLEGTFLVDHLDNETDTIPTENTVRSKFVQRVVLKEHKKIHLMDVTALIKAIRI